MSARDKLAEIISDAENCTDEEGYWALPEDVADAVVAAGWRPPARDVTNHADEAIEMIEGLRAIIDSHPNPLECGKHDDDDPVLCGWKIAYTQIVQQISEGKAA